MNTAQIARWCNEIEDIATEIRERTISNSYFLAQNIIDNSRRITAEISAQPKTNADRIRRMSDEELSAFLGGIADNCSYSTCDNCPMYGACVDVPLSRDKWLKKEVSGDAVD